MYVFCAIQYDLVYEKHTTKSSTEIKEIINTNSSNKAGILVITERFRLTQLWNPWAAPSFLLHPHRLPRSHRHPLCDVCGSPCRCHVL